MGNGQFAGDKELRCALLIMFGIRNKMLAFVLSL